MRRIAWMLLLVTTVFPASGQAPDPSATAAGLKAVFGGSAHPLTIKLKDLNGDWRRFSVGGQFEMGSWMQMLGSMMGGGGGSGVYYSKGDTLILGSDVYIIAYRPQAKGMDFAALMQAGQGAKPPAPEKLTPESTLTLSLVNLRTAGSLNDIRPFDMQAEIAESESQSKGLLSAMMEGKEGAEATASLSNLKQIGTALAMYIQDWDEKFPPMTDAETAKKALMPYIKNEAVFAHPDTKQPYAPNPILSGKKLAHIGAPAQMVAFYETAPAADNTRGVVFVDGHAKRVPEDEWPALKRASKIP